MQADILAANPSSKIHLLGVNAIGSEDGNQYITLERTIPWLQDTTTWNVWTNWNVTVRDVDILGADNVLQQTFNLTNHDLKDPANYAYLKFLLKEVAGEAFTPPVEYATGRRPLTVATGDLAGDGALGVVTADAGDGTVSIFKNTGGGVLGARTVVSAGLGARSVVLADVNDDGKLDVLVAATDDAIVAVLLNQGDGTFAPRTAFSCGADPVAISVADVNGDGIPDVVVANRASGTISVLLGDGYGAFGPRTSFATGGAPTAIATGDLDGDGTIDVVTANPAAGTISVLRGRGDGTFAAPENTTLGHAPSTVAVFDVDADGHLDVVTTTSDGSVVAFFGDGTGALLSAISLPIGSAGAAHGLTIADVNGDSRPDIVVTTALGVSAFLGTPGRTFTKVDVSLAVAGQTPSGVAVADLSGDGLRELVVTTSDESASPAPGTVSVFTAR